MERQSWELGVYKRDLRYKNFERVVKVYTYTNWTREEMHQEVRTLRRDLYREEDGWRLEFNPYTTKVRSLMTGKEVEIRTVDQGTCCDPSQERYWSM